MLKNLFKTKEVNIVEDNSKLIIELLLKETTTSEKLQIFSNIKESLEKNLHKIMMNSISDYRLIQGYDYKTDIPCYSAMAKDPIFERKLSDIEVDFDLVNAL